MKGPWIVLAISLCATARPATAQHEAPSHDDRSSGDVGHGDAGYGDSGHGDVGGHDSPADSSPSSGGDSGHSGSGDPSGSPDASPSWSDSGNDNSHDRPDAGVDVSAGGSSDTAGPDADSAPPPGARPRDPDSVEPPPTDAQERHPRPEARPDDRFPNPPVTDGTLWDDRWLGFARSDDDEYSGWSAADFRKQPRGRSSVTLHVDPAQAAVYIDGRYAGIAKDIGGKRLFLPPGVHEMALELEGYVPLLSYFDVSPDQSVDVRAKMVPLQPR